jgi:hypothetical protein
MDGTAYPLNNPGVVTMEEAGMPRQGGPIGVMLYDGEMYHLNVLGRILLRGGGLSRFPPVIEKIRGDQTFGCFWTFAARYGVASS